MAPLAFVLHIPMAPLALVLHIPVNITAVFSWNHLQSQDDS